MTYISTYHQNPSRNMMPIVKPHCSITLLLQISDIGQQGTDRNHQETHCPQTNCSTVKQLWELQVPTSTHTEQCSTHWVPSGILEGFFSHSVIEYTIFVLRSEYYLEFTTTHENLSHTNSISDDLFFFSQVVLCTS